MASQEEQILLTSQLKVLTDKWCENGKEIVNALRAEDKTQLHVLREQQNELKREMDTIRDTLLKEDKL